MNSSDDLNLVLYTNADPKFLEKHSLAGMNIKSFYINDKDILLDRLSTHNLMYLPLAFDEVSKNAKALTPVPGGVGPMTIACLLKNTIDCFKRSQI